MLNQIILVGRIRKLPEADPGEDRRYCDLPIEVVRSYQNAQGEFESDVFTVKVWRGAADIAREKYTVGNIIGVKARLEQDRTTGCPLIIAEKLSFIQV
jgi:single-stranded DNA-binding protein